MSPTESHHPITVPSESSGATQARRDNDSRMFQLVEQYRMAMATGNKPDRRELLQQYPEHAESLAACLDAIDFVHEIAPQFSDQAAEGQPADSNWDQPVQALGDFRILHELGRGGMAVVYKAEQLSLGRTVALKVLPFASVMDQQRLQRFKNEAMAAATLDHPNIVSVYSVGCERGVHFYAMQCIEGQTLAKVIGQLRQSAEHGPLKNDDPAGSTPHNSSAESDLAQGLLSGQFPPQPASDLANTAAADASQPISTPQEEIDTGPMAGISTERSTGSAAFFRTVAKIGVDVSDALDYTHERGIVHRDIKPSNLILDNWGKVWVTDFGLARVEADVSLTMTGDLLGTLRYMSPEQVLAKRMVIDHRTDVYSLGATLYELLALQPVFDGQDRQELIQQIAFDEPRPLRRLNKAIPTDLETIVGRAMTKDPRERYATAKELADDLRRFLDDKPIMARRPSLVDRAVKWSRRHRAMVLAAAIVLLMTTVALAVSTVLITLETNAKDVALSAEKDARNQAEENLYDSLVGEASALRLARAQGYRTQVFKLIKQARELGTDNLDIERLRDEAVMAMGDFLGYSPVQIDGFPSQVRHVALRPGSPQVAVGLTDGTIVVRDRKTRAKLWQGGHSTSLKAMRFSPDGQRLSSVDKADTVKVWQAGEHDGWDCVRTVRIDSSLRSVEITQNGSHIVAVDGSVVSLWSLTDLKRAATYDSGGVHLHTVALSPDKKYVAAGYDSFTDESEEAQNGVLVWDTATREIVRHVPSSLSYVYDVAFSPDSKLLACACNTGLLMFGTADFQQHTRASLGGTAHVAFSPDSRFLAIEMTDRISLWSPSTGREIAILRHPGLMSVSIGDDGSTIAVGGSDSVRIWDFGADDERISLSGHIGACGALAFTADGGFLVSGNNAAGATLWNLSTRKAVHRWSQPEAVAQSIAFSPDGKLMATGGWHKDGLQIWDARTHEPLVAPEHEIGPRQGALIAAINCVAFSPNGRYFAACGNGMALWQVESEAGKDGSPQLALERLAQLPGQRSLHLCFSPDNRLLAWVINDNEVRLWDVENSREMRYAGPRLSHGWDGIMFYPDASHLLYIDTDGGAGVWSIATGQRVSEITPPGTSTRSTFALSPNGRFLAVLEGSRGVKIWDTKTQKRQFSFREELSDVHSLAWGLDSRRLAVGLSDGGISVWDITKINTHLAELSLR